MRQDYTFYKMQNVLYFLLCLFSETFEELTFVDHHLLVDIAPQIKLICANEAFKEVYPEAVSIEDLKNFVAGKLVYSSSVMDSRELNLFLTNICAGHKGVIFNMRTILPKINNNKASIFGCPVSLPQNENRKIFIFGGSFYGFSKIHFKLIKAIHAYSVKKKAALLVVVAPDSIVLRRHVKGGPLLLSRSDRIRVLKNIPYIDYLVYPDSEDIYKSLIIETNASECIICAEDRDTIRYCIEHRDVLRKYNRDLTITTFQKINGDSGDVLNFEELACQD